MLHNLTQTFVARVWNKVRRTDLSRKSVS